MYTRFLDRASLAKFITKYLFEKCGMSETLVQFSVLELKDAFINELTVVSRTETTMADVENALLYLSKIQAINLDGGFFVLYNAMQLNRLNRNNRAGYKKEDYSKLDEFYRHKIQQIHIIGEFANMMVQDYSAALQFVHDYFQAEYKYFIEKYFKGRKEKIERNITSAQYQKLFGTLSSAQTEIIDDASSRVIVVAAGPGSGKTKVLVHKLAALYQLEDVKHEQLLMLTFSRAAATEFKKRLIELIGNAAHFIDISTFHSYAFNLLGKVGNLEDVKDVINQATKMIEQGEVETGLITKTVIVIDEAQDMSVDEFNFIKALMSVGENTRLIAVGDDDQNIYEFRNSSSEYMRLIATNATIYYLPINYRSAVNIVSLANDFLGGIINRLKKDFEIKSETTQAGTVRLIKHKSKNMEIPLVQNLLNTYTSGTAAVLTATNEDALRVFGLLQKHGIRTRLIQENPGFNLLDLAEIRYFLKQMGKETKISNSLWESGIEKLQSTYGDSDCLPSCLKLLSAFEITHSQKYQTDLQMFISESKFEHFFEHDQSEVVISTIHKAKGREFDSVYMMLPNAFCRTDEEKRIIYVGITRAKTALYVHFRGDAFTPHIYDETEYAKPDEIIMELSHKDVILDFFKGKKELILSLRSGEHLYVQENALHAKISEKLVKVCIFSRKFREETEKLKNMGYTPAHAKIRFIVAWKSENDAEHAILLPTVAFRSAIN
jgi:ATP-dependent DNA helicase RecQ